MDLFYIGKSKEYIQADHALSNRSTCKGCGDKIAKEEARLAYVGEGSHSYKHWYHIGCFVLKPKYKDFDPEQQVYNLDHLEDVDYERVLEMLKEQCQELKKGGKLTTASKSKQTKAKAKGKKKKQSESEAEQSDDDYNGEQSGTKKTKREQRTQPVAVFATASVFSQKQQQDYKTLVRKYLGMSAEQLKKILALNSQSKTGTKTQLAEKCADGEALGRIPSCPSCGGGKPRFSRDSGTYRCPGYMDDDEFKNCGKTFTISEIERGTWTLS